MNSVSKYNRGRDYCVQMGTLIMCGIYNWAFGSSKTVYMTWTVTDCQSVVVPAWSFSNMQHILL